MVNITEGSLLTQLYCFSDVHLRSICNACPVAIKLKGVEVEFLGQLTWNDPPIVGDIIGDKFVIDEGKHLRYYHTVRFRAFSS